MLSLKLFNAVPAGSASEPVVDTEHGIIIGSGAGHAATAIKQYYKKKQLSGEDLNKSFHKSWKTVIDSTSEELAIERAKHYASTYGSNFTSEIYLPNEEIQLPKGSTKVKFIVVNALTDEQIAERCIDMLASGIALAEETLNDIMTLLDQCSYRFTGEEDIKNKEAMVLIAKKHGVYPSEPVDALRCMVYLSTDSTLLIKNAGTCERIASSGFDIAPAVKAVGHKRMAEIFNRFKPLFMAFKKASKANVSTVNAISKLSKVHHKPLPENALSVATSKPITDDNVHWLKNATVFALFTALNAIHLKMIGRDFFMYRIRNGKTFAKQGETGKVNKAMLESNYCKIIKELQSRVNIEAGELVYIPENIQYALPTSAKAFVGNIPEGTKFLGKSLAVGIYWENSWGARDLDLSGIGIGKVGWNSSYDDGGLTYSGDCTSAPNGAVEYLYIRREDQSINPTLVMNNVYTGEDQSKFNIIVADSVNPNEDFMMNPDNLLLSEKVTGVSRQGVIGLVYPEENDMMAFCVFNMGAGDVSVSSYGELSDIQRNAFLQKYQNSLSLNTVLEDIGFELTEDKANASIDLSVEALSKDTFINLLTS